MKKRPYTDRWALPGGLVGDKETLDAAARRILIAETGVRNVYLEQLCTFGEPTRDPLGRVVSVAYLSLMESPTRSLTTSAKYADVRWWDAATLPSLAYDHKAIARYAIDRLRAKLSYSNIAWSLLPKTFTLSQLQRVYESVLGRTIDKRNFRKRIASLQLVEPTGTRTAIGAFRPAMLYTFASREPRMVEIL